LQAICVTCALLIYLQEQLDSPVLHVALFLFIAPGAPPAAHAHAPVAGVTTWARRSGAVLCRAAL